MTSFPFRSGIVALLAAAAACASDGGPASVPPTVAVRFFNATTGLPGNGAFTTNGQFAAGSVLGAGQSAPACATVGVGTTSFGFGSANAAGNGLDGGAIATLDNQSLAVGGSYALVAAGSATSARLYLLDHAFAGSLAANQAAVRFVNLAPEPGTSAGPINVFKGTLGVDGSSLALNVAVGAPTPYTTVSSGSNVFSVLQGHTTVIAGSDGILNLQAGSVNTIAIIPAATPGGYRLVHVPSCL